MDIHLKEHFNDRELEKCKKLAARIQTAAGGPGVIGAPEAWAMAVRIYCVHLLENAIDS